LHAAATTGEVPPQDSAREARAAAEDAADEIENAKSVLVNCTASLAEAKDTEQWAKLRVERAVAPVLTSKIDKLLAEAEELHAALEAKLAAIDFLTFHLPPGATQNTRIAPARGGALTPGVMPPDRSQHSAAATWVAAHAALMRDATAPLPK
jgi:hypothetical protein